MRTFVLYLIFLLGPFIITAQTVQTFEKAFTTPEGLYGVTTFKTKPLTFGAAFIELQQVSFVVQGIRIEGKHFNGGELSDKGYNFPYSCKNCYFKAEGTVSMSMNGQRYSAPFLQTGNIVKAVKTSKEPLFSQSVKDLHNRLNDDKKIGPWEATGRVDEVSIYGIGGAELYRIRSAARTYLEKLQKQEKFEEAYDQYEGANSNNARKKALSEMERHAQTADQRDQIRELKDALEEEIRSSTSSVGSSFTSPGSSSSQTKSAKRKNQKEEQKKEKSEKDSAAYAQRTVAYEENFKTEAEIFGDAMAASAEWLYYMGGVIYSNMGYARPENIFKGKGLYLGIDFGYSFIVAPVIFAKQEEEFGTSYATKASEVSTLNLGLRPKFGYDSENYGGIVYGHLEGGLFPWVETSLQYGFGTQVYGGFKFLKLLAGYETGQRVFTETDGFSYDEYGKGKTSYRFKRLSLGLKASWYDGPRDHARNHITLGLMEEAISEGIVDDEKGELYIEILEEGHEPYLGLFDSLPAFQGYFLEWQHDHHGILRVELFPKYAFTGYLGGPIEDNLADKNGGLFIQIAYTRSIDQFFGK